MTEGMYPAATPEIALRRKQLAPEVNEAFENFGRAVFADGALPQKVKQLIAVAVAHVTQCPYCITGHTRLAHRKGATPEEVMEAIWIAAEMRAGGAYAHSTLALHALGDGVGEPAADRSGSPTQPAKEKIHDCGARVPGGDQRPTGSTIPAPAGHVDGGSG